MLSTAFPEVQVVVNNRSCAHSSLLTPTAFGKSERQVVHWSLRKKVWSDGTLIRATFSTSALARRSIILPEVDALPSRKKNSKEQPLDSCTLVVMRWTQYRLSSLSPPARQ